METAEFYATCRLNEDYKNEPELPEYEGEIIYVVLYLLETIINKTSNNFLKYSAAYIQYEIAENSLFYKDVKRIYECHGGMGKLLLRIFDTEQILIPEMTVSDMIIAKEIIEGASSY